MSATICKAHLLSSGSDAAHGSDVNSVNYVRGRPVVALRVCNIGRQKSKYIMGHLAVVTYCSRFITRVEMTGFSDTQGDGRRVMVIRCRVQG